MTSPSQTSRASPEAGLNALTSAAWLPTAAPWGAVWRRFRRDRGAVVGLIVVMGVILAATLAPVLAPFRQILHSTWSRSKVSHHPGPTHSGRTP